jgi:hypothetical protein
MSSAAAGVGRRDDDRPVSQIEPAARIERVEIGPHHHPHIGGRKRLDISEAIHRAAERSWARRHVGELPARDVHGHQRIEIEIGIDAYRMRLLLGDRRRFDAAGHGRLRHRA